jgi:hypothetical protein
MTHRLPDVGTGCRQSFTFSPFFHEDVIYCCRSCAFGGLCTCSIEIDLADDGVDGLGLPFALPVVEPAESTASFVRSQR